MKITIGNHSEFDYEEFSKVDQLISTVKRYGVIYLSEKDKVLKFEYTTYYGSEVIYINENQFSIGPYLEDHIILVHAIINYLKDQLT